MGLKKGLSFVELLIAIVVLTVFGSAFLIVLSQNTRSGVLFWERAQALNLARERMNELYAVGKEGKSTLFNSYNNVEEDETSLNYPFKRKTFASQYGGKWHFTVEVTNGTFNNDGSMGNDIIITDEVIF